jgi:hypothetical protein
MPLRLVNPVARSSPMIGAKSAAIRLARAERLSAMLDNVDRAGRRNRFDRHDYLRLSVMHHEQ